MPSFSRVARLGVDVWKLLSRRLAIDRRLAQLLRLAAAVVVAGAAAAAAVVVDAATLIAHSIHSTETGQPAQPGSRRSGPPSYPNMSVDRLYYSHKGELRSRKEEHTATLGLLYYSHYGKIFFF